MCEPPQSLEPLEHWTSQDAQEVAALHALMARRHENDMPTECKVWLHDMRTGCCASKVHAHFGVGLQPMACLTCSEAGLVLARRHAARSLDARAPTATLDAAIAKRFATDACFAVADRALQVFGGCAFSGIRYSM